LFPSETVAQCIGVFVREKLFIQNSTFYPPLGKKKVLKNNERLEYLAIRAQRHHCRFPVQKISLIKRKAFLPNAQQDGEPQPAERDAIKMGLKKISYSTKFDDRLK